MALKVDLDGVVVDLTDCDWVLFSPCGCPQIVLRADEDSATAKAAWIEMGHTRKEVRERKIREGFELELMTHDRYVAQVADRMRASYVCPHR